MGRKGNGYTNAHMESFWSLLNNKANLNSRLSLGLLEVKCPLLTAYPGSAAACGLDKTPQAGYSFSHRKLFPLVEPFIMLSLHLFTSGHT